jgi:hypothetical protein
MTTSPKRAPSAAHPTLLSLHADGKFIKTASGQTISLRGTNLGGWLLQECWMSPAGDANLPGYRGFKGSASQTWSGAAVCDVTDGNVATRWTPGVEQASGQWLMLDLGASRTFNQLSLDAGAWPADAPGGVVFRLSHDGEMWWDAGWVGDYGPVQTLRIPHQSARYVQAMLTHPKPGRWWSVANFRITVSDDFHTRARLTDRFGGDEAQRLLDVYRDSWITLEDIRFLAQIGFNCLRVPMDWQMFVQPDGVARPDGFERIDWLLDRAEEEGLYVILDLHGMPGGANPWHSSGIAGQNAFWIDPGLQDIAISIWSRLARRFRGRACISAFDLINEPLVTSGGPENPEQVALKHAVLDRLYRAVRAEDPERMLSIPVFPDWRHAVSPARMGWTNVVYQTHHYSFQAQEHHDGMKGFIAHEIGQMSHYRDLWNVPVYAGEFWFGPFHDLYEHWLEELNRRGLSWTSWTYKVKNSPQSRGPDGVLNGVGWSLFHDNPNPAPDLDYDSFDTIARKWRMFSTVNFRADMAMQAIYRRHARSQERDQAHV